MVFAFKSYQKSGKLNLNTEPKENWDNTTYDHFIDDGF